jgi:hypothetical protein
LTLVSLREGTIYPSEYELLREKNIKEREELVRNLFSDYWTGKGHVSISRQIMEEVEEDAYARSERDEDDVGLGLGDEGDIEMEEIGNTEHYSEVEYQEELDQDDFEAAGDDAIHESSAVRRSCRLQNQALTFDEFDQDPADIENQRSRTPPPPEEEREEPWHYANVDGIWQWRDFCRGEIFKNIHQVEDDSVQVDHGEKRGSYRSTTVGLDRFLESSCTRRFIEWRRAMADGLSNEALDELLDILHSPDFDRDLLPRNHYYLEKLQDRALAPFMPKTTRWRIPKKKNELESEEIVITDIEHLLRLQLQDPDVARSILTEYSHNDGLISHPSHGELWRKLVTYDAARDSRPLCLKVFT